VRSRVSNLEQITGKRFSGKVVALDGREFIDCRFTRCLLRYRGGKFRLGPGCKAVDCQPEFSGAAGRTIKLLEVFDLLKFKPNIAAVILCAFLFFGCQQSSQPIHKVEPDTSAQLAQLSKVLEKTLDTAAMGCRYKDDVIFVLQSAERGDLSTAAAAKKQRKCFYLKKGTYYLVQDANASESIVLVHIISGDEFGQDLWITKFPK
jgi:hypothetical protein